ncbi:protein MANBAL-like [Meleagris gallopavo]|nr:protein MANBAL-like [Meleagris gallopavo]
MELGLGGAIGACVPSFLCGPCKKAASLRAGEQQAVCCVAAEGRFSPAEIPEPTLAENELRRGVFSGATLQLLCALAAIVPVSRCHKPVSRAL